MRLLCFAFFVERCSFALRYAQKADENASADQIRAYISTGWDSLTRSLTDCATVVDTKLATASVLYLPADFAEPASPSSNFKHGAR